jgi:catechol 2,3-dioxygenase-like lactoylglutathione lyase family enzyme
MAIRGNRIYHVNSNCSDLDRSVLFYEALGLTRVLRTVPSRAQSGLAFGLDEVSWDAWMMHSDDGMGGLSLDLLEWKIPAPIGTAPATTGEPGFNRLVFATRDLDETIARAQDSGGTLVGGPVRDGTGGDARRVAMMLDPDGVAVQLVEGDRTSIVQVIVNCSDIEVSLSYYRDVMGLRPVGPVETVSHPGELHGLDRDGSMKTVVLADAGSVFTVALVEWIDPHVQVEPRVPSANELGLFRMAWSTEDCGHDEEVVRAAGSVPFAPTGELSVGDDLPLLLVLFWPGPNGECLEVIEVTGRSGAL